MSYQPLWLRDLVAYSIQAAVLVGVGIVMARALRLRLPQVRHAYWQALLAVCVFLPLLQPWRPEILESSSAAFTNVTLTAAPVPAPTGPSIAGIVLWLICAGVILRIVWMALGLGRLWLYRRYAERIEQIPDAVAEARRLAPVSPVFFISRQIPTPATFGFFHPAVLFPARFLEMESAMQKAIALHELLHVERRDWLWNMFEELVLTLLWFHLPLWWVVRSVRLSREQVVDAEAVRRSNARRPYLKALLEMAGQRRLAESLPAPLFLRENQLAERVALMMKEIHMSRTRLTVSILTAAVTLLVTGASLVWAFPLKTPAPELVPSTDASAPATSETRDATETALPGNKVASENEPSRKTGKVYKVGGIVKPPVLIKHVEPPYTPEARRSHLSGTVVLSCVINAKGNVVEVKERSKPLGQGLDESAVNTVRNWKFKPGMRKGVPVPVKVMVEVSFRYYDQKKADPATQKPDPAPDARAQGSPNASADANRKNNAYINQDEIQRRVDETMKQAHIAQEAASKVDQAKIQEQINQAMTQLQNMNTPDMRQRMQEQMKRLQKLNTAEMWRQRQKQMKHLEKLKTPEMRQQIKQAMEQAKIAQQSAAEVNKAEIQREVEQARKDAVQAGKEVDTARLRAEAEKARKDAQAARAETKQARKDAAAARKEAEKLNQQMKKQQLEMLLQLKARRLPFPTVLPPSPPPPATEQKASPPASPAPSESPAVPPSADKLTAPPAAPPASPAPPSPPQN